MNAPTLDTLTLISIDACYFYYGWDSMSDDNSKMYIVSESGDTTNSRWVSAYQELEELAPNLNAMLYFEEHPLYPFSIFEPFGHKAMVLKDGKPYSPEQISSDDDNEYYYTKEMANDFKTEVDMTKEDITSMARLVVDMHFDGFDNEKKNASTDDEIDLPF